MPIRLPLPRHPIHLLLPQLLQFLRFAPRADTRDSVIASIALTARSAAISHIDCASARGAVDVHGVFGGGAAAGEGPAAGLGAGTGGDGGGVVAEAVEVVFHGGKFLGGGRAGDDGAVF